jgi:hypothetical protein
VEISVYELTSDGLEPFAPDEVVEAWRSGEGVFWVDVVGEDDEWRKLVLAEIGASAFVQRAVHDRPDIASVVEPGMPSISRSLHSLTTRMNRLSSSTA